MDETGSDRKDPTGHDGRDGQGEHIRLAAINHAEYDALADLFLGDGGYAPDPIGAGGGAVGVEEADELDELDEISEPPSTPTHATHTPVLQLTRHEDDAELTEQLSIGSEHDASNMHPDSIGVGILESLERTDERASALLAELLGEQLVEPRLVEGQADETGSEAIADHPDETEHVEMARATVELVVLGHLPVRATLWARQYACARAKEQGQTVALIRAASGSTSMDLISAGEPIRIPALGDLEDAIELVSERCDRVILRVDEASEPELLDRPEVEEITILSGADEAAIVASYRLIKALDLTFTDRSADGGGAMLRLAVMGASDELATEACSKLRNAVETFIDRPVEIVVGSGRIDAGATTNVYRDSQSHPAGQILDGLIESSRRGGERAQAGPEAEPTRVEFPSGGVSLAGSLGPSGPSGSSSRSAPDADDERGQDEDDKKNRIDSVVDSPTVREGLCAMLPGLVSIEARCPKAPGVELALDERGSLHLIASDAECTDVMNRLLAAQSWARNNFGLLIRAEPKLAMPSVDRDAETDAEMHLISIDPRALHEIYDTSVRVYALARVRVGKVIAQVATPIN